MIFVMEPEGVYNKYEDYIHLYRLYQLLKDFFFSRYTQWLILWFDEFFLNLCWSVRIQDFGVGRLNPELPRVPCIEHSLDTQFKRNVAIKTPMSSAGVFLSLDVEG